MGNQPLRFLFFTRTFHQLMFGKGFCCYNMADYNGLTEMQKQKLLDQHSKELVVMNN
jgi:hypothetical protein